MNTCSIKLFIYCVIYIKYSIKKNSHNNNSHMYKKKIVLKTYYKLAIYIYTFNAYFCFYTVYLKFSIKQLLKLYALWQYNMFVPK